VVHGTSALEVEDATTIGAVDCNGAVLDSTIAGVLVGATTTGEVDATETDVLTLWADVGS
jgi:hypothetical protein